MTEAGQAELKDGRDANSCPPPLTAPSSLVGALVVLGKRKRLLASMPLIAAAIAAIYAYSRPDIYTATTRLVVPQQSQSAAAAALNQLGGLAALSGASLRVRNQAELYVAMLKSDGVADAIIERFRLKPMFKVKYQADARIALKNVTRLTATNEGVLVVEVDAKDPRLAADIANAYDDELNKLTGRLALGEASRRRLFFERQLLEAREKLERAENKLRPAIDAGGLASIDAQGRAALEMAARLRAEISAREVQLDTMRAYATGENPDLMGAERQLASLRQELARLESGRGRAATGDSGESGIANARLLQEFKYQQFLVELLAKQYEVARVDESRDEPAVQTLDRAAPPELRSKPHRLRITAIGFGLGLLAAILTALVLHVLETHSEELAPVVQAWALRRRLRG